jgi:hypothetical protein
MGAVSSTTSSRRLIPPSPSRQSSMSRIVFDSQDSGEQSGIAASLYALSLGLVEEKDVIAEICAFHERAPLRLYHYTELINLVESARNCPADAPYQLLLIAKDMLRKDNIPGPKQAKMIVKIVSSYLDQKEGVPVFNREQRMVLKELGQMFKGSFHPVVPEPRRYGTRALERVVREQKRRQETGVAMMTESEMEAFLEGSPVSEGSVGFDPTEGTATQIDKGAEKYKTLKAKRRRQIDELALLFTEWETAYDNSKRVWEIMQRDPKFEIGALLSRIQLSFADFLVRAIRDFMSERDGWLD